jgi:hypothetical protein
MQHAPVGAVSRAPALFYGGSNVHTKQQYHNPCTGKVHITAVTYCTSSLYTPVHLLKLQQYTCRPETNETDTVPLPVLLYTPAAAAAAGTTLLFTE